MKRSHSLLVACLVAAVVAVGLHASLADPPDVRTAAAPAAPDVADPDVEEILDSPPAYLARVARERSMLLIGEVHGASTAPKLTGEIAEAIAKEQAVVVALEWPETEQPAVDAYLASAGNDADVVALAASRFWHDERPDGRTSQDMLALLERLRVLKQGGADVRVVCFDWDWEAQPDGDRDAALAERLRAARTAHAGAAMIVLTGNYHARIGRGAPWNPEQAFAGWQLRDLDPFNVDVRALQGSAWICTGDAPCGRHELGRPPGAQMGMTVRRTLDARGYWATLTVAADAASEPVVQRRPRPAAE